MSDFDKDVETVRDALPRHSAECSGLALRKGEHPKDACICYHAALGRIEAELARLREEAQGYRDRKFKEDYIVENERLREALVLDTDVAEMGRLRRIEEAAQAVLAGLDRRSGISPVEGLANIRAALEEEV